MIKCKSKNKFIVYNYYNKDDEPREINLFESLMYNSKFSLVYKLK